MCWSQLKSESTGIKSVVFGFCISSPPDSNSDLDLSQITASSVQPWHSTAKYTLNTVTIYWGHYTKHQIRLVIGSRGFLILKLFSRAWETIAYAWLAAVVRLSGFSWNIELRWSITVHSSISADINCAFLLKCANCSLHATAGAALSETVAMVSLSRVPGLSWQVLAHRTKNSGPIWCLLHLNSYSVPTCLLLCG